MIRKTLVLAMLAAAALPALAVAGPSKGDRKNAARECRAERSQLGSEAFAQKYGTNRNKRNAFGKCVSRGAREEQAERRSARKKAKKQCRAEREQLGSGPFAQKYGTNRNKRNAFGKCVSGKARKNKAKLDKQDREENAEQRNAAKRCKAERDQMGEEAFAEKYGTNKNKSNAFGKCVSKLARS